MRSTITQTVLAVGTRKTFRSRGSILVSYQSDVMTSFCFVTTSSQFNSVSFI